ncbi:uncharacterized protein SCHCODRAFT_02620505 [Schizophyllum commune H4-8]|uniref:uncharacterized protein n=1 Tax=Schizophyllum commune (strain H4-8 / FGSC 9210) TaxID=578458 RepID=UPI00215ECD36|nr:uncharacterized protein SCHCODRAFT_02620505 [Schizophyllum commune H4-8]KAI5895887.1 hypothetical protein SCHCODRAFT_02620505 [Schizophyllum commune H4-8]
MPLPYNRLFGLRYEVRLPFARCLHCAQSSMQDSSIAAFLFIPVFMFVRYFPPM